MSVEWMTDAGSPLKNFSGEKKEENFQWQVEGVWQRCGEGALTISEPVKHHQLPNPQRASPPVQDRIVIMYSLYVTWTYLAPLPPHPHVIHGG